MKKIKTQTLINIAITLVILVAFGLGVLMNIQWFSLSLWDAIVMACVVEGLPLLMFMGDEELFEE